MRRFSRPRSTFAVFLAFTLTAFSQDLHIKKSITVGGNFVSSSETSIKGARERTVTETQGNTTVTIRQCDLKRTLTLNEQAQTYLVSKDPQDEAALRAAALVSGAPEADAGGQITVTTTVTDTGERKPMFGYTARHPKMTIVEASSPKACSAVNQKFEIDGWYADIAKEQAGCQHLAPPVRQGEGCHDTVVSRHSGSAKAGYPLAENITIHQADASTLNMGVMVTQISKQTLEPELFDVPAGYKEVQTYAELRGAPQAAPPTAYAAPSQQAGMAQSMMGQNAMMQNAMAQNAMAMMQSGQMNHNNVMGNGGGMTPAPAAVPQALGPKAAGKIRIGVAPPQAQVGQGNNTGDYSTPIRNSIVLLMSGPAIEIAALDSHLPMQIQAEAQQKECDYVLFSEVSVKHGGGGFGKFMKMGSMAANMTPVGAMGHMSGAMAASAAAQTAAALAQQQAMSQLAGFNGQIKSKDEVTVGYHLYPTGQAQPRLESSLKGKAQSDGEDVLTPMLQQTANSVLTEVSKK
ncbi:MAG: hypothetical protein JST79_19670 [Acidobacteria bacterium]|nr:hypothetical protein [Acidobacteriota bacterium]